MPEWWRIDTRVLPYSGIVGEGFKELAEAEPVEYDVIDTEKGVQAVNVKGV